MSLHARACFYVCGCVPFRSLMLFLTKLLIFFCWREQFGLKCHFCQEGKLRIQMYSTVSASGLFTEPEALPRRHRRYKVLWSFFFSCIVPILHRFTSVHPKSIHNSLIYVFDSCKCFVKKPPKKNTHFSTL